MSDIEIEHRYMKLPRYENVIIMTSDIQPFMTNKISPSDDRLKG